MRTEPALVILLHGVGSRGQDLAPLAASLASHLPGARFAAPDAPEPFDAGGPGRQWFSVKGVTEANRPGRVASARAGLDTTLRVILDAHGVGEDLSRVALLGFSQGAIIALDAVASGRWPVGAVVAMAGRLATPGPLTPSPSTRVLLLHGEADGVMPVRLARDARADLAATGIDAELRTFPGLGHGISQESLDAASRFLTQTFTSAA